MTIELTCVFLFIYLVVPKHGLQTLGKVGAIRRIPPPVNFPSLKSESSGNNSNINLVPSGGQGWVKDKSPDTPSSIIQQQTQDSSNSSSTGPLVDSSSDTIVEKTSVEKDLYTRSQNQQQQNHTIASLSPASTALGEFF